tara:strand:+ start:1570 stop:2346 length:777 start_codon:yes stop_codon:yes gene_type:complete
LLNFTRKIKIYLVNKLQKVVRRLILPNRHRAEVFRQSIGYLEANERRWKQRGSKRASRLNAICEFGVWNGDSLLLIWESLKQQGLLSDRKWTLYGFDSFEGMPDSNDNRDLHDVIGTGSFRSIGKEYVEKKLAKEGIPPEQLKLTAGFFEDSLNVEASKIIEERYVCFANIDTDYYSSTMVVLDWLEPKLFDGALIYFDDIYFYNGNPHKGQLRAIDEFNSRSSSAGLSQALGLDPVGRVYLYWNSDLKEEESEGLQF